MIRIDDLNKVNNYEWIIPSSYRDDMRVPVKVFSTRLMLEQVLHDKSLEQAINASSLPGLEGAVIVMPDMHQGYGFPIGGVAASNYPNGVISPGGIGYDINCGVRLLASSIPARDAMKHIEKLAMRMKQLCPSGVGSNGMLTLSSRDMEDVLINGSRWAIKKGFGTESDLRRTEENGSLQGAMTQHVSERAKQRGRTQLGSLGAGNHFIEVDIIEDVFDENASRAMGLKKGNLVIQIHCGSRGLGHQVCSDYVKEFQGIPKRLGINIPDRELVCAPLDSPEGKAYLGAMKAAGNYAYANRQLLTHAVRQAFLEVLSQNFKNHDLQLVYDLAHNMAQIENHKIGKRTMTVCIHRKGATRAFGPNAPGLPPEYQAIGQPILVPGSMGTASWVLVGTSDSMEKSFGSCCHGAGRVMSRSQAKKEIRGDQLRKDLENKGISILADSMAGLAEEAPQAYKDVDEVVETVTNAKIARKVARLTPLAVIKG